MAADIMPRPGFSSQQVGTKKSAREYQQRCDPPFCEGEGGALQAVPPVTRRAPLDSDKIPLGGRGNTALSHSVYDQMCTARGPHCQID
eukprot:gene24717-biopygen17936